jgi:hypothetical protein
LIVAAERVLDAFANLKIDALTRPLPSGARAEDTSRPPT